MKNGQLYAMLNDPNVLPFFPLSMLMMLMMMKWLSIYQSIRLFFRQNVYQYVMNDNYH